MSSIKELVDDLDRAMVLKFDEYNKHQTALTPFRGVTLDDEKVKRVNEILADIQSSFNELYPALHFVVFKHQQVSGMMTSYEAFIEQLKKAGAQEEKRKSDGNAAEHIPTIK